RVHLVLDTVGGGRLHELLSRAAVSAAQGELETEFVRPDGAGDHLPLYEANNVPDVMSPWELRSHVDYLLSHCEPSPALPQVVAELDRFVDGWTARWAMWGDRREKFPDYLAFVIETRDRLAALQAGSIQLDNKMTLLHCLRQIVFLMAVERPERARSWGEARPANAVSGAVATMAR